MPAPILDPLVTFAGHPLVCVFAPSPSAAAYEQQARLLGAAPAGPGYVRLDLLGAGTSHAGRALIAPRGAAALRAKYGVGAGAFCVVLTDAAGHVRHRSDAPLTAAAVRAHLGAGVA